MPRTDGRPKIDGVCKECGGEYYAKYMCIKHYFKSRRTTTRQLIADDAICEWDGCERRPRAKGYCGTHYNYIKGYASLRKVGGTDRRGKKKKEVVGYRAAHIRVESVKGKAKTHKCIDCGEQAREWSLNPNAVHTYEDGDKVWSLNIDDYDPRCVPCHRDLDGGYSWHDYVD